MRGRRSDKYLITAINRTDETLTLALPPDGFNADDYFFAQSAAAALVITKAERAELIRAGARDTSGDA